MYITLYLVFNSWLSILQNVLLIFETECGTDKARIPSPYRGKEEMKRERSTGSCTNWGGVKIIWGTQWEFYEIRRLIPFILCPLYTLYLVFRGRSVEVYQYRKTKKPFLTLATNLHSNNWNTLSILSQLINRARLTNCHYYSYHHVLVIPWVNQLKINRTLRVLCC